MTAALAPKTCMCLFYECLYPTAVSEHQKLNVYHNNGYDCHAAAPEREK